MKYIYTFGLILLATLAQSQALVTFVNNHAFHTLMDVEVVNSSQVVIAGEAGIAYVGASDPLVVDAGTALTVKWYHSGTTMLAGSSTYTYDNSSQNISLAHGTSGSNFAMTTQKMELITNFDLFKCDAMNCVPGSQSVNFILRSTQQLMGSALTYPNLPIGASNQLPVADYILDITPAADIYNGLFAYQFDNSTHPGEYHFLFTSGPVDNQDCYALFAGGGLVNLPHLPPLTGVDELNVTMYAYPNPVQDVLTILTNDGTYLHGCTISLVDQMGRTVEQLRPNNVGGNQYQLDLSRASAGLYNVVFTAADGNIITKQVVIE